MSRPVTVYGSSDDLIEIEGEITEEFSLPSDDKALLAFSEGTVLRVTYGRVWRITKVQNGTSTVDITQCPEDDEHNYSDVATIHGPASLRWVVLGSDYATAENR